MEKRALLFLMGVLFVNMVSASYNCSIGSIITDSDFVNVGEVEFINGINIGVFSSGIISADVLIDAKQITLTNESSSMIAKLLSGDYNISLANLTGGSGGVKVGGTEKDVEEGGLKEIGKLQVYTLSLEGTYPGEDANVELLVGKYYEFLYNKKPTIKKTIDGVEYLFELSSSVSGRARINVQKCENGSLIEIDEVVEEVSDDSDTDNESLQNDIQNQTQNESSISGENTTDTDNLTSSDLPGTEEKGFRDKILSLPYLVIFGWIIVIIVFYIMYKKNKSRYEKTPSSE